MTIHETSKRVTVHDGGIEWFAECSCGWGRLVRFEVEADIDIGDHQIEVQREARRLAFAYSRPLPDDGITP